MAVRKSLFRLAFLLLVLPVGIVFFLHSFGENKMEIPVLSSLKECGVEKSTHLLVTGTPVVSAEKNQLDRIRKRTASKQIELSLASGACFSDTLALLLIDQQSNLRGTYELAHNDINRFFAELDILLMIENYGKGVYR